MPPEAPALTAFPSAMARLFFGLPTGRRFLLAGGAALLIQGLSERPTDHLDFFTRELDDVR